MRNKRSETASSTNIGTTVRPFMGWTLKGLAIGAVTLGVAAGLAACSETSAEDPLPLGESDSGVIVEDAPVEDAPAEDAPAEDGAVEGEDGG